MDNCETVEEADKGSVRNRSHITVFLISYERSPHSLFYIWLSGHEEVKHQKCRSEWGKTMC